MATTCKLIAKTTLGSSATSIGFTSIPATYTDLLVVVTLRGDRSSTVEEAKVRFNGAGSDSSHSCRLLTGNGSGVASASVSYIRVGQVPAANSTSNTFGSCEVYIPNYAGSTNKSMSITGVGEGNITGTDIDVVAGLWSSTNAIDALSIIPVYGTNWVSGSNAFLYGITKS